MSAVKGGDYVLVVDVYRQRDENGAPRRFKRGDTVTLTAEKAERLLRAGAVAKPSSDEAEAAEARPGSEPVSAPAAPVATSAQVASFAAAATNSGLGAQDASGGVLSDEQRSELHPALSGDGPPPKSATVDVWRKWAVDTGRLSAAEADEKNKGELQALA